MSLTRIKYGVEFETPRNREGGSSGIGWIVVLVLLVAAISFSVHVVRRMKRPQAGPTLTVPAAAMPPPVASPPRTTARADARCADLPVTDLARRNPKVRNYLLRLKEAAEHDDVQMQVSAIEMLLTLPADSIADLEDQMVRRLGALNLRLLFELKNGLWVVETTVRRGETATRIAAEHGSTLGSLRRLNPGVDLDGLRHGAKLSVMNHPDLSLIVRTRMRAVDLQLNGKLFKRYNLPDDAPAIPMEPGGYRAPANVREFFRRQGVGLTAEDAAEIDLLVPRDTPVIVSAT